MGTICCDECGIVFTVPNGWHEARRRDHARWYCPNGHIWSFVGESEADKLRRERDRLKQQIAYKDDEIRRQADRAASAERRVIAAKGQVTKLQKRAKAASSPVIWQHSTRSSIRRSWTSEPRKRSEPDLPRNTRGLGNG